MRTFSIFLSVSVLNLVNIAQQSEGYDVLKAFISFHVIRKWPTFLSSLHEVPFHFSEVWFADCHRFLRVVASTLKLLATWPL